MALITRLLTNTGAALYSPSGDLLANTTVKFDLVNAVGQVTDAWDAISRERVGGKPVVTKTDENGEFSVSLWPNARGASPTQYRCIVVHPGFRELRGVVEDEATPLDWADFTAAGTMLTPMETGELAKYLTRIEAARVAAEEAAEAAAISAAIAGAGQGTPFSPLLVTNQLNEFAADPAAQIAVQSNIGLGTSNALAWYILAKS